jgi:hypothetical protein
MATFHLINKVHVFGRAFLPGTLIDDAVDPATAITDAGGRLYPSANATVAAAATIARDLSLRGQHEKSMGIMLAAASKADALGADTVTVANATATNQNATATNQNATATNQNATATNQAEQRSNHVRYSNPPAADLVSIVAALDPVADGALTIAAQPVVPCKVQVRIVDGDSSISAGTVALNGVGPSGEALPEQVIPLTGGTQTVVSDLAYATISATVAGVAGAAAGDTISIGASAHLGLPRDHTPLGGALTVYKASADDADEAIGTVDSTAGTISPTTAPNGTHDYDFWYRWSQTVVQDAHTHVQDAHTHVQDAHTHVQDAHGHTATIS